MIISYCAIRGGAVIETVKEFPLFIVGNDIIIPFISLNTLVKWHNGRAQ